MPDLMDLLARQLGGGTTDRLAQQVGADPGSVEKAIGVALPLLVGALARNTNKSKDEARSLDRALERDHDGSLLESFGALLGGGGSGGGGLGALMGAAGSLLGGGSGGAVPKAADGDGILGHILGGRRATVEQGIGRAAGLDQSQVAKLLPLLAPLLMGALGKAKRERGLDADGLTALLNRERSEVESQAPGVQQGGLLSLLDRDDDGQVIDDLAGIGAALGSAWLASRRK